MYRENLIAAGLLRQRDTAQECERDSVLQRLSQGEEIQKDFKPIYCVFRKDEFKNHVIYEGEFKCKNAELIENKLTSGEAWRLCNMLNIHAPDIQKTQKGYSIPMYGICKDTEWAEWDQEMKQLCIEL